jgi:hypothetical protein
MKSLNRIGVFPASVPLAADDVVEFHVARLLLLLRLCGTAGHIDGLTKLAKLDFFVRYPDFFAFAKAAVDTKGPNQQVRPPIPPSDAVESAMIRHHYGPWDKRYYHVLAHLEAKGLVHVTKHGKAYRLTLTDLGQQRAKTLEERPSFAPLVVRMREVKKAFGNRTGTALKNLVYQLFNDEVASRSLGQVIRR